MKGLVGNLIRQQVITHERVAQAMMNVDRGEFWDGSSGGFFSSYGNAAYEDTP